MTVNKNDFLDILKKLNYAVSSKNIIEEFKCVFFDTKNIIASNGKIIISHPFKIDFTCVVYLEKILKYLEKVKSKEINITYKDNKLIIKENNTELQLLNVSDNNELFKIQQVEKWNDLPDNFYEGLKFSLFSTTSELNFTHPYINYIIFDDNKLFSTNNLKLSQYKLSQKVGKFCIYNSLVIVLLEIPDIKQFSILENQIVFKTENNLLIYCSSKNMEFPDYESLLTLPKDFIEIDFLNCLNDSISFCDIFNTDLHNNDKNIMIKIEQDNLLCYTQTEQGRIEYKFKLDKKYKEKIIFVLNPILLDEIIKQDDFKCCYDLNEKIYFYNKSYVFITLVRKIENE
jgi:hypothetical protein